MKTEISIEFFPPQTPEGLVKLRTVRTELAKLNPEFFSVTYGARGSTRERTFSVVKEIAAEGFQAAPHLSCIGSSRDSIRENHRVVVVGKFGGGSIEFGFVAVRPGDQGTRIVGHDQGRHTTDESQRPTHAGQPIGLCLPRCGAGEGIA